MSRRGLLLCSLAAVLFGVTTPIASRLAADLGAFRLAGLLYVGAALAVAPLVARQRPGAAAIRRSAAPLATAVVLGGMVGPVLLAAGIALVPAATSSLLLNLELVFTTLFAAVLFHEHVGREVAMGTVLVAIGGVVLAWQDEPELRWGAVLVAGACACWAIDNGVTAGIDQLTPSAVTLAKGLVAGTANLVIGVVALGAPPAWPTVVALVIGAAGYGASITLWVAGARELGAARGQLVFATAPFIGAGVAWVALGEPVRAREVAAALLAAVGVGAVLLSAHEHDHDHDALDHDHDHVHDDGHHDHEHGAPPGMGERHAHRHVHTPLRHAHPHVPDLHHRHDH